MAESDNMVALQNESVLRAFFDGSPDAVCIRDRERRLVLWNKAFSEGVKAHCGVELKAGMRAEDYCPEEILSGYEQQRELLMQALDGEPQEAEFAYPCPDGQTRHLDVRWAPIREEGEVVAVAEICRDITELKSCKVDVSEKAELFQEYLQCGAEPLFCFEMEPPMPMNLSIDEQVDYLYRHTRVGEANQAWAEEAGFSSREELIGLPLDEVVPRIVPENVETIRRIAEANYKLDSFITHDRMQDGTIRTILNNHTALIKDGCLYRTWGGSRDITDQEADRAKSQEAEIKYRSLVENAQEAIVVTQDGVQKFFNPKVLELTGYTADDLREMSYLDYIHPDDREMVRQRYSERIAGGAPQSCYEVRIITKSGQTKWLIVNSARIDWEGRPASLVMLMDITERVTAQKEAARQREALTRLGRTAGLEQMAGSIAHELNQPLTGILSNAQAGELLLNRGQCSCEDLKEIIEEIVSDTKRAGDVIRNLRDLYRRQDNHFEWINLNDLVEKTVKMLRSEFVLQHVQLIKDLDSGIPEVQGNAVQLQQVMINLIANAHDAMQGAHQNGRSICIVTSAEENDVVFWVRDSGSGIKADKFETIFEPFATWKPGGTGMGLAISNSIIHAHGGRMRAVNSPEGGAKVGFIIPVKKEVSA